MKREKPSRTAQYMALFRALETMRPQGNRLFGDPYAINFLDRRYKNIVRLSKVSVVRNIVEQIIGRKIPGALSSGIARTKYIDERLQYTIKKGTKQVILLGAGFDTRALRLGFLRNIPIIEVDHPNTAAIKQKTLKTCLGALPANTKYFQIDFNLQRLDDLITWNNIDVSIPTTIIWEGVSNYLSPEAVRNTFQFVEKFTEGSYIIFTYVHQMILDQPNSFYGGEKLLHDLDQLEERWTFGFRPERLKEYLSSFQLSLLEDKGADEYRRKYLPERMEKGYEFYRVAFAKKRRF